MEINTNNILLRHFTCLYDENDNINVLIHYNNIIFCLTKDDFKNIKENNDDIRLNIKKIKWYKCL